MKLPLLLLEPPHPPTTGRRKQTEWLRGRMSSYSFNATVMDINRLCMGFPTKLQRQFVSSQVESIFHFLSPSPTLMFALSLMLLIFVKFNLFVETEEIDRGWT